jgi:hypothetical protein
MAPPRIMRLAGRADGPLAAVSPKGDPYLCWNCGKPGAALGVVGDRRNCPECEVTWVPEWSATRGDPNYVCWMGRVIFCVDFTRPESLGAPA